MRSKLIIFLSVFSLLGVFGMQDLQAQVKKVQKTYYYACHHVNNNIKRAWVTPVSSVTVYETESDKGRYVWSNLASQWEDYLEGELGNNYLGRSYDRCEVDADREKVQDEIRKQTNEYKRYYQVSTLRDFSYIRTQYDKESE